MTHTKINEPVITPDRRVTTIAQLDAEGKIKYSVSNNWRNTGRKAYFADLETDNYWQISKAEYLSRTGQR